MIPLILGAYNHLENVFIETEVLRVV
jgi:hypothetical protein